MEIPRKTNIYHGTGTVMARIPADIVKELNITIDTKTAIIRVPGTNKIELIFQ